MDKNEQNDELTRKEILRTLVDARARKELRQVDVAKRMGVGQPSVSEFERGEVSPRLGTLQRYARAVGMKLKVEVVEGESDDD